MDKTIEILPLFYDYLIDKNYPINVLVGGRASGKSYLMEQMAVIKTHNSDGYTMLVLEDVENNVDGNLKQTH